VARELERLGAVLVDADQVSRELMVPGSPVYQAVLEAFGPEILAPDGSIDRAALGRRVFSSPEDLERLNRLTHPPIWEELRRRTAELSRTHPVVVLVAPLLLEHGGERYVDQVWVVACPEEQQVARLMARDGFSFEEATRRIAAQMPTSQKVARADVVIHNDGSLEELRARVEAAWSARVAGQGSG
jgi:dephospho-CoA kinase